MDVGKEPKKVKAFKWNEKKVNKEEIYRDRIFSTVVNFFTEDNWSFSQIEDEPILRMKFKGKNGKWQCYAQVREAHEHFVFYSLGEVNVPENKRFAIAEFLTRANYGLIIGNFELDFSDGQIRYKTSIDIEDTELNSALIKQLVYANVLTMDKYLPGIMKVIYGEVSPQEAIAQIEGQS